MRTTLVLAPLAISIACGGATSAPIAPAPTAAAPSASASAETVADLDAAKRTALTRARAREIGAAAATWRHGRAGTCPTPKDLTDKYAFAPDTEKDAIGTPFTIECTDAEIRVLATGREIVHVEPYGADATAPPRDPLPTPPPADSPVPDIVRRTIGPRIRACYNDALKRNPDVSGNVHGTIVIAPNGSVKSAVIDPKTTTIRDAALLACVTKAMKSATFDPSSDGERTITF